VLSPEKFPDPAIDAAPASGEQTAVLAGGCFWCVEAVYLQLDGVHSVKSGYAGGTAETADYESVCTGTTDHAEAVEISYDPAKLSYGKLLKVFFSIAHDPTEKDRQGNDIGRQYRSAIFYADAEQKRVAEAYIRQLGTDKVNGTVVFERPIVTEVVPLDRFYPAETYHQNYAARNPLQPYVLFTARPKVDKVRKYYKDQLKRG
jgi:peptide-methionine (S)-S-oxide reductase